MASDDDIRPASGSGPSRPSRYGSLPVPTEEPPAYTTQGDVPDDFKYGTSVAQCETSIRMAFVRKVYTILGVQIGTTCAMSALYMSVNSIKDWTRSNPGVMIFSSILALIVLLALIWKRREYPMNFYLLAAFTLLESHSLATVVTFYNSNIVLKALVITFGIFVGLSLFSIQTKYDFSGLAPFLYMGLWGLLLASIIQLFFPFGSMMEFGLSLLGVFLFCGFILFDTQMIFERLSPEEYIMASVELYLDLLNLFLFVLRLLDSSSRD